MATPEQLAARELWLTALESQIYPQGYGALHTGSDYCCLGVACEVLDLERDRRGEYDGQSAVLPIRAQQAMGLLVSDPVVRMADGTLRGLTDLNDTLQLTHPQIAAIIRSQPDDWDGS